MLILYYQYNYTLIYLLFLNMVLMLSLNHFHLPRQVKMEMTQIKHLLPKY